MVALPSLAAVALGVERDGGEAPTRAAHPALVMRMAAAATA